VTFGPGPAQSGLVFLGPAGIQIDSTDSADGPPTHAKNLVRVHFLNKTGEI
jgi:hypothetical protein